MPAEDQPDDDQNEFDIRDTQSDWTEKFHTHMPEMKKVAKNLTGKGPQRFEDGSDAAVSAFRSFFEDWKNDELDPEEKKKGLQGILNLYAKRKADAQRQRALGRQDRDKLFAEKKNREWQANLEREPLSDKGFDIGKLLKRLSAVQRTIVEKIEGGYSFKEICEIEGWSPRTVTTQMDRIRKAAFEMLEEDNYGLG